MRIHKYASLQTPLLLRTDYTAASVAPGATCSACSGVQKCREAEPNLKLSVQLSDRTTDFFKKADYARKQCNKSLQNCSTAQPASTVVKQNIAIFCVKCDQVILKSSVVQSTGANEIHDFNNILQFPAGRSLLLYRELADE